MKWAGRPRVALVLTASVAAFTAAACFGGPPPPPPPPSAQPCQSAGAASTSAGKGEPARAPSDQPIPPDQAGGPAREVASTTHGGPKNRGLPLTTPRARSREPPHPPPT